MTVTKKKCTQQVLSPQVLWPAQNSQGWHPLRLIMSHRGSITYGMAKELAYIICPLVSQSSHHLKNTQHFVEHIQKVKVEPDEVMTSYDVKGLFTSVSVDPTIKIVKQKLLQDPTLPQKDQHVHPTHQYIIGVLPQKHILPLPR